MLQMYGHAPSILYGEGYAGHTVVENERRAVGAYHYRADLSARTQLARHHRERQRRRDDMELHSASSGLSNRDLSTSI
jgi:hypothetical protein